MFLLYIYILVNITLFLLLLVGEVALKIISKTKTFGLFKNAGLFDMFKFATQALHLPYLCSLGYLYKYIQNSRSRHCAVNCANIMGF